MRRRDSPDPEGWKGRRWWKVEEGGRLGNCLVVWWLVGGWLVVLVLFVGDVLALQESMAIMAKQASLQPLWNSDSSNSKDHDGQTAI